MIYHHSTLRHLKVRYNKNISSPGIMVRSLAFLAYVISLPQSYAGTDTLCHDTLDFKYNKVKNGVLIRSI